MEKTAAWHILNEMSRISGPWYYGGKQQHLDFILPLLPDTMVYVEPFGGMASVLLNREPTEVEVYNDIYEPAATFMRVAKDRPTELSKQIHLSPYSRRGMEPPTEPNDMETARYMFIRCMQQISALGSSHQVSWARVRRSTASRRIQQWRRCVAKVAPISERLQGVTILNRDALEVIAEYDSPDTLFYLDPPYVHGTRGNTYSTYTHELDDTTHERLADLLGGIEGMAAVSGYMSPLYEELFPSPRWKRYDDSTKKVRAGFKTVVPRVESLWVNYEI